MTATGVLAHEQAAVRALPWHEGRVAKLAYHWPCCRPMSRPAAHAMSASRCPGRAWLRSHLAHQPRAGVRRKLPGAVEHEEVSSWQRENVDGSKYPVDGVFALVVCGHHGDVLAWHSGTTTSSPLGDRRTACPASKPDDCRRGGDRPRPGICDRRVCAGCAV